jgi:hypothetical protein
LGKGWAGQLTLGMGQHWVKFAFFLKGLLHQVRGFLLFFLYVFLYHSISRVVVCAVYACVLNIYFSICRLKIYHMTEMRNMYLFLDPVARLQTVDMMHIQNVPLQNVCSTKCLFNKISPNKTSPWQNISITKYLLVTKCLPTKRLLSKRLLHKISP